MWLSDVTIVLQKVASKDLAVEILVGRGPAYKITFQPGERVCNCKLPLTLELTAGVRVYVTLIQGTKYWPKAVKASFPDPRANLVYEDKRCKITLNVVSEHEPLEFLVSKCSEFTRDLQSVLSRLGKGKQTVETTLTLATALGELNPIAKAAVGLVSAAHKHLRDQETQDEDVKRLAKRIQTIFERAVSAKHATRSAERMLALLFESETMFVACVEFIQDYCSKPAAVRASEALMRTRHADKLKELQRDLEIFVEGFEHEMFIFIADTVAGPSSVPIPTSMSSLLPPKPMRLFGRDAELDTAVAAVLQPSSRIAILGGGGMGKTTLALEIIYDERVEQFYDSRLFVTCEGATSLLLLIAKVADQLGIPSKARDSQLDRAVLHLLAQRQHLLLCLDNFETVWEDTERRTDIEQFLGHLHAISSLGLIVTIRGTERPVPGLRWTRLSPLTPLAEEDAVELFEDITGEPPDSSARELIREVACIPLAVTLVATLAQDEDTVDLLQRWQERGTSSVKTSGTSRLHNLDASILLTVHSPRMRTNSLALDVLSIIALLPDGLSGDMLTRLVSYSPSLDIYTALDTLKHVALISKEQDVLHTGYRYHSLPPIRRWCSNNLKLADELKDVLYRAYVQLLQEHRDHTSANHALVVKPELVNTEVVLLSAFNDSTLDPRVFDAALSHSYWSLWLGHLSNAVMLRAAALADGFQKARCLQRLGECHMYRDELDEAETVLKAAQELHRQTQDVLGQANDLQSLGDVYLRRDQHDEAETAFKAAQELHWQAQDVLGQANALNSLGYLYLQRGKLDEAETAIKSAHELHRQAQNVVGQGNDLNSLGDLYLRRGQLDEAKAALTSALELHRQAHIHVGQSGDLCHLGQIYMRREQFDEAERVLQAALQLSEKACSDWSRAFTLLCLGELDMRKGNFTAAERSIHLSLELYRRVQVRVEEADAVRILGQIYTRQGYFEKAEETLQSALRIHREIKAPYEEQQDLDAIEELRACRAEGEVNLSSTRSTRSDGAGALSL